MITIIPQNNMKQSEIFMETENLNECMHQLITNKIKDNKQNYCSRDRV